MIGIVTPYKTINFGTKLQAYAMQELMSEFDEAEIINFNTKSDLRFKAIIGKLSIEILKNKLKVKKQEKEEKKNAKFYSIKQKRKKCISLFDCNYKFSDIIKNSIEFNKYVTKYTDIVCGSDQLWAPRNIKADWFTLSLIPDNINKFSFAASFGVEKVPNNMIKKYKKYLNRLNYIGVREQSGKKIVQDLIGREPAINLDPTLMLDKNKWNKLIEKSSITINEKYVFCYFLGTNIEHRKYAEEIAKKIDAKLVTIPHFREYNESDINFGDIQLEDVSPIDFVSLIANSEFICTDSFHGTVFSIIYEKEFAVFERFKNGTEESTNSRIYSILDILDLKNRLVLNDNDIEKIMQKINYQDVNERLLVERKKSLDYLKNALKK